MSRSRDTLTGASSGGEPSEQRPAGKSRVVLGAVVLGVVAFAIYAGYIVAVMLRTG